MSSQHVSSPILGKFMGACAVRDLCFGVIMGCALSLAPAQMRAQSLDFTPVIAVNDTVITQYEVDQRATFLGILNAPGDLNARAREVLVEERLQMATAQAAGITITQDQLMIGIDEFAARANLDGQGLIDALENEGVAYETLRDFINAGLFWREVLRSRFGASAQVSEAEIDRAVALGSSGGGAQIRLAELILPIDGNDIDALRAELLAIAEEVDGNMTAFSDAARARSAAPTAVDGGALDWRPLSSLPQGLSAMLITLDVGDVTEPVPLGPGIGIFQMLGFEEARYQFSTPSSYDYATILLSGPDAAARAAEIAAQNDRCDDLYGTLQGQFERISAPRAEVPADIAAELAKLDPNESSTTLRRNNGVDLLMVWLCNRTVELEDGAREDIRQALFSQRLETYASGYLEELRADAIIRDLD